MHKRGISDDRERKKLQREAGSLVRKAPERSKASNATVPEIDGPPRRDRSNEPEGAGQAGMVWET